MKNGQPFQKFQPKTTFLVDLLDQRSEKKISARKSWEKTEFRSKKVKYTPMGSQKK